MKYTCILTALWLCTQSLIAQPYKKRTPEEKARFYTDEMVKDLQLDSLSAVKVFEINLLVSKQFDSLYAGEPDATQSRAGAIAIYRQRDAALRQVLSKQQFLQFDDLQREKREKRKKEKAEKEAAGKK